jgi:hypothetical protein
MRAVFLATALLLGPVAAALAEPPGRYAIEGTNPGGGGAYRGSVQVTRTGDTFRVSWEIDGTRYVGTGIGDDKFLTVTYRSGNETGLALYSASGSGWEGIWTYAGGTTLGRERWARR